MIQPFAKLFQRTVRNKLATRNWTMRLLQTAFGKLNLSTDGDAEWVETGEGGLVLRVLGGSGSDHPFKVIVAGDTARVIPGFVYANDYSTSGHPIEASVPRISGVSIANNPPPAIGGIAGYTGFIVLRMVFAKENGMAKLPWTILKVTSPNTQPLVRALGEVTGQDSAMDMVIAQLSGGKVTVQGLSKSLWVGTSWNEIIFGEV